MVIHVFHIYIGLFSLCPKDKTELNRGNIDISVFFLHEINKQAYSLRGIPFSPLHLAYGPCLLWILLCSRQ